MKANYWSKALSGIILIGLTTLSSCELEDFDLGTGDERDNIVDVWKCAESSTTFGEKTYQSEIYKSDRDSLTVYINNFYFLGENVEVYGTLRNNRITIPQQTAEGHVIAGSGTVASNYESISFIYTADDGSGMLDDVSASYSRN